MATKLQCEICGGKLIGKPGGIFECENCGTEYSTEWAKAKIQEITGTVKVEGTVEVQGTVKVEGPVKVEGAANKESLLKRGTQSLEDGDWNGAKVFFNQVLSMDAECAEAFLGLAMAETEVPGRGALLTIGTHAELLKSRPDYLRFKKYAAQSIVNEVEDQLSQTSRDGRDELARLRRRIAPVKGLVSVHDYRLAAMERGDSVYLDNDNRVQTSKLNVDDWRGIGLASIAVGAFHVVGLKYDGTVVAVGHPEYSEGAADVSDWTGISAIAAGNDFSVGLKADKTLVIAGNVSDLTSAENWTDIEAISAKWDVLLGLKANGAVVVAGKSAESLSKELSRWTDIVAISSGRNHSVGLKYDGTVVAVGNNEHGACNVNGWTDIIAVSAGNDYTVGLKKDGTVVAAGFEGGGRIKNVEQWSDIVGIEAGYLTTVGIRSNGTTVCSDNFTGIRMPTLKLFNSIHTLEWERHELAMRAEQARKEEEERAERERKEAEERAERERREAEAERQARIRDLNAEKTKLNAELANLKGLFTGKRRKEIETRLTEIDAELKRIQK